MVVRENNLVKQEELTCLPLGKGVLTALLKIARDLVKADDYDSIEAVKDLAATTLAIIDDQGGDRMNILDRAVAWFLPDFVVEAAKGDHNYDIYNMRYLGRFMFYYDDGCYSGMEGRLITWRVYWRPLWWYMLREHRDYKRGKNRYSLTYGNRRGTL